MTEANFHASDKDNLFLHYECGLVAGQRVALRKKLIIRNHRGVPTGKTHPAGELWQVLPGLKSDPVLWFRMADGERCTWNDNSEDVAEWFEVVESDNA
jgi:hypothetical protein